MSWKIEKKNRISISPKNSCIKGLITLFFGFCYHPLDDPLNLTIQQNKHHWRKIHIITISVNFRSTNHKSWTFSINIEWIYCFYSPYKKKIRKYYFAWKFNDYRIKQLRSFLFASDFCSLIVILKFINENIIIIICERVCLWFWFQVYFFPCNWESNGFFVSAFDKIMASYTERWQMCAAKKKAKQVTTEQLIHFNCSFCLMP